MGRAPSTPWKIATGDKRWRGWLTGWALRTRALEATILRGFPSTNFGVEDLWSILAEADVADPRAWHIRRVARRRRRRGWDMEPRWWTER